MTYLRRSVIAGDKAVDVTHGLLRTIEWIALDKHYGAIECTCGWKSSTVSAFDYSVMDQERMYLLRTHYVSATYKKLGLIS